MPVITSAPTRPTVSLYEGKQGELYLSRGNLAFPIPGEWPTRLAGHPNPFRADAEPWAQGIAVAEPTPAAERLRATLQGGFAREVAVLRGGQVDILTQDLKAGTRAYLGLPQAEAAAQTTPAPAAPPEEKPKPAPRPAAQPDPFDAVPRTLRPLPEIEVRLGPDLILCLFRDSEHPQCWYLLAHNADGDYMSAWAKGVGATVPEGVWALAADAIGRRHFIAKHGRR